MIIINISLTYFVKVRITIEIHFLTYNIMITELIYHLKRTVKEKSLTIIEFL